MTAPLINLEISVNCEKALDTVQISGNDFVFYQDLDVKSDALTQKYISKILASQKGIQKNSHLFVDIGNCEEVYDGPCLILKIRLR